MPEPAVSEHSALTEAGWTQLIEKIRERECVPFLGAGASLGFGGAAGLPTAGEIARGLAAAIQYPGSDKEDFLRVCQYYELVKREKSSVRKAISRQLRVPNVQPGAVHRAIATLPFSYVLTTNYDDLMEGAMTGVQRTPVMAYYDLLGNAGKVAEPSELAPLVYKLHGTLGRETTMLCTEDDVVRFLACLINGNPALPDPIKTILQEKSFLFVGYGLKDWNIRVILRALRHAKTDTGAEWSRSFAVQRRPDHPPHLGADWDASVLYWDQRENVQCFDVDAAEFMTELASRYKQAYPEDTYPKQAGT